MRLHVGIVGSRRRDSRADRELVFDIVAKLYYFSTNGVDVRVVSGGCRSGADSFAKQACDALGLPITEHLTRIPTGAPYWRAVRELFDRNTLVARDSLDLLVALVAPDRTGGTEDTVMKYERMAADEPSRRLVLL